MTVKKIALVTCAVLPNLDEDDQPLVDALRSLDVSVDVQIWDDQTVAWDDYDAVVVRSTWDYSSKSEEFSAWVNARSNLLNPAIVISNNIDKYYLKELGEQGIPIIKTLWLDPAQHLTSQAIHTRLPAFGDYVIKPTISAGGQDTARYQESTAKARGEAILHARELLRSGRHVMVQPYLEQIDEKGETGLIFFNGEFSHAIRKDALLERGHRPTAGLYRPETKRSIEATAEELELAAKALSVFAASTGIEVSDLLYARVDMLPDDEGNPTLLELELTEPSLFFATHPDSTQKFAKAILARV